jgi:hypothetical protein
MKGTYIQLISQGSENIHTNLNATFSYFKNVYKRYNQFVIESEDQYFVQDIKFGSTVKININKKGDLMSKTYLQIKLPSESDSTARWVNRIGYRLIKKVELIIGSQLVDKQTGLWMYLWTELNQTNEKKEILDKIIGTTSESINGLKCNEPHDLLIPLQLFFCRNIHHVLPLLKLFDEEVFLKFYIEKKNNCIQSGIVPTGDLTNSRLWIDFIYLDENEKKIYIHNDLEYIFDTNEHIRKTLTTTGINNVSLPFTKPSKELVYVAQNNSIDTNSVDKFTGYNQVTKSQLKINSVNVYSFGYLNSIFTNKIVPFKCHSGKPNKNINCIPLSIYPENLDFSGIVYFKSIKNLNLMVETNNGIIDIFSVCYSKFKIKNNRLI